jgi:uncharacterized protein (UPF0128 family)
MKKKVWLIAKFQVKSIISWALNFILPSLNGKKIWLIVKFYSDRAEQRKKKLGEKYEVLQVFNTFSIHIPHTMYPSKNACYIASTT